jgi:anti-anti-sigma factor
MKLDVNRGPQGVVVRVSGRVAEPHVQDFNRLLQEMDLELVPEVRLDMAGVSSISSTGLGALIAFRKRTVNQETSLRLVNVPAQILAMLQAVKLDKVLDITPL